MIRAPERTAGRATDTAHREDQSYLKEDTLARCAAKRDTSLLRGIWDGRRPDSLCLISITAKKTPSET